MNSWLINYTIHERWFTSIQRRALSAVSDWLQFNCRVALENRFSSRNRIFSCRRWRCEKSAFSSRSHPCDRQERKEDEKSKSPSFPLCFHSQIEGENVSRNVIYSRWKFINPSYRRRTKKIDLSRWVHEGKMKILRQDKRKKAFHTTRIEDKISSTNKRNKKFSHRPQKQKGFEVKINFQVFVVGGQKWKIYWNVWMFIGCGFWIWLNVFHLFIDKKRGNFVVARRFLATKNRKLNFLENWKFREI